jgi:hypothetical protein
MQMNNEQKRQAMSAVVNVQALQTVGMAKLTGGVALYTARIRQMDRQSGFAPGKGRKTAFRSAIERDI